MLEKDRGSFGDLDMTIESLSTGSRSPIMHPEQKPHGQPPHGATDHSVPLTIHTVSHEPYSKDGRHYHGDEPESRDSGITSRGSSWQSGSFREHGINFSPGSFMTLPAKKPPSSVGDKSSIDGDYDDADFSGFSTLPTIKPLKMQRGYESEMEYSSKRNQFAPRQKVNMKSTQPLPTGYVSDADFHVERNNRKFTDREACERDYMSDLDYVKDIISDGETSFESSPGKFPFTSHKEDRREFDRSSVDSSMDRSNLSWTPSKSSQFKPKDQNTSFDSKFKPGGSGYRKINWSPKSVVTSQRNPSDSGSHVLTQRSLSDSGPRGYTEQELSADMKRSKYVWTPKESPPSSLRTPSTTSSPLPQLDDFIIPSSLSQSEAPSPQPRDIIVTHPPQREEVSHPNLQREFPQKREIIASHPQQREMGHPQQRDIGHPQQKNVFHSYPPREIPVLSSSPQQREIREIPVTSSSPLQREIREIPVIKSNQKQREIPIISASPKQREIISSSPKQRERIHSTPEEKDRFYPSSHKEIFSPSPKQQKKTSTPRHVIETPVDEPVYEPVIHKSKRKGIL